MTERMATPTKRPSALLAATHINELPDECLLQILSQVGNAPLPIPCFAPGPPAAPEQNLISHPLLCSFVCRRWRALAPASVRSLALHMDALPLPPGQGAHLRAHFPNLENLHLHDRVPYGQSDGREQPPDTDLERSLPELEPLAPNLQTLDLRLEIANVTLPAMLRIFSLCGRLRSLTAEIPCFFEDDEMCMWLDVIAALPSLITLKLRFQNGFYVVYDPLWERLGGMQQLQELHLKSYSVPSAVGRIPEVLHSLDLRFDMCDIHKADPVGHLTSLRELLLRCSHRVIDMPEGLGRLSNLTRLELFDMGAVTTLPEEAVRGLRNLEELIVSSCVEFETLPESVGTLSQLRVLRVDRCYSLPESLGELKSLQELFVRGEVERLPGGICRLLSLRSLRLMRCGGLQHLPDNLGDLTALTELDIVGCPVTVWPESLSRLTRLRVCNLVLPAIKSLPESLGRWVALEKLRVSCPKILLLPDAVCHLERLQTLSLCGCKKLVNLPAGIGRMPALVHLRLRKCPLLRGCSRRLSAMLAGLGTVLDRYSDDEEDERT